MYLASKWANEEKEYTEVIFSTQGNFEVGFYQEGKEQHPFAKSGYIGTATCFMSTTEDFKRMKTIVDKVLEKLKIK